MDESGHVPRRGSRNDPRSAPFFVFVITFLMLMIATFPYSCFSVDCLPEDIARESPGVCAYSSACANLLGMDFGRVGLAQGGTFLVAVLGAVAITYAYQRMVGR